MLNNCSLFLLRPFCISDIKLNLVIPSRHSEELIFSVCIVMLEINSLAEKLILVLENHIKTPLYSNYPHEHSMSGCN